RGTPSPTRAPRCGRKQTRRRRARTARCAWVAPLLEEDREPAGVLLAVARVVFVEQRPVARVEAHGDLLLQRDLEAAAGAERHQRLLRVDIVRRLRRDVRGAEP